MTTRSDLGSGPAGIQGLFEGGTAAGLTDGQLLEQFATRTGDAAERAFEALVGRHGGMVLRACRGVLGHEDDARDAFQAVFLALAQRGSKLWVRDSVGPWLHRVAVRAALRARRRAERRRAIERRVGLGMGRTLQGSAALDLAAVVHEEVDRLPDRYRVAVLLCDLEGRTVEQAAHDLGCPIGTIKSRLSRARDQLRARLTRRGLAPGLFPVAPGAPVVPEGLARLTVVAAVALGGRGLGPVAVMLATPIRTHLAPARGALLALVGLGVGALGVEVARRPGPIDPPVAAGRAGTPLSGPRAAPPVTPPLALPLAPQAPLADPFAWRRVDRYVPPDFSGFFGQDKQAGSELLAIYRDGANLEKRSAAEVVALARRGWRTIRAGDEVQDDQEEILRWIGRQFIWDAAPQDPDAIELMYHAADPRGPRTSRSGSLTALYYGLMRVQPATPAILHSLADYCMAVDNPEDWSWVEFAGRGQQAELISYLKPYLESPDPAMRDRAAVVAAAFRDDPNWWQAYAAWAIRDTRMRVGDQVPGLIRTLRDGTDRERLKAIYLIFERRLVLLLDEEFVAALRACTRAEDRETRYRAVGVLSGARLDGSQPWHAAAVGGVLDMLNADDPETRYDAVYYGVTWPPSDYRKEEIVRALVAVARRDREPFHLQRVVETLQHYGRDLTIRVLDESLRGPDPAQAEATRAVYRALADQDPPAVGPATPPEARAGYVAAFRGLHGELKAKYPMFALKRIDWDKVGRDLLPRVEAARTPEEFGLLVEELVARLQDSHAAVLPGTATPPRPPSPVFPEWGTGIACLVDDQDRLVVYEVPAGTPAHQLGVRPGMAVIEVNGGSSAFPYRAWIDRQRRYVGYSSDRALEYDAARQFLRQPNRDDPVTLELADPDGRTLRVDLKASYRGGYIRRLPVLRPGIDDGQGDVQAVRLDDGVGYLMVRRIRGGLEVGINQALVALKGCTGLIVDVRGNSGGGFDTATAFRNFDPAAPADPGLVRYAGPIALLIDERCISAGEGWASWFVAHRRARLFGSTTAGASSRKETYELSNGLYKVQFSVKAYTGFLDRPIERLGLVPDVPVRCTARDLAAGRDTVAEAAAAWLKEARVR